MSRCAVYNCYVCEIEQILFMNSFIYSTKLICSGNSNGMSLQNWSFGVNDCPSKFFGFGTVLINGQDYKSHIQLFGVLHFFYLTQLNFSAQTDQCSTTLKLYLQGFLRESHILTYSSPLIVLIHFKGYSTPLSGDVVPVCLRQEEGVIVTADDSHSSSIVWNYVGRPICRSHNLQTQTFGSDCTLPVVLWIEIYINSVSVLMSIM